MRTLPERSSEAILKAVEHWYSRRQATAGDRSAGTAFSIAISREAGARGTSVAQAIGRCLGWQVYDQELLQMIARELGLRDNLLKSVDEHHISWLREVAAGFASAPVVSESAYVQQLIETVLSLGTHGECVIVGRGATFMLPRDRTLRLRLIAPLAQRIEIMAQDFNLTRREAEERVRKLDHNRRAFIQEYFSKDLNDPVHYDLVLNVANFSVEECAELAIAALHQLQKRKVERPHVITGA
jgi:cytidylate kinase